MFEDALVESSGKLRSKSKRWMLATSALNLALVAVAILIPLLHPEALPRTALTAILTAPPPPPPAPAPATVQVAHVTRTVAPLDPMLAPTRVPHTIDTKSDPPPPAEASAGIVGVGMTGGSGPAGSAVLSTLNTNPVIVSAKPEKPKQTGPVSVSSGVAAGAILTKTTPLYPAIAKAAHVSGSVMLHAIISKAGTIESLQVVSGPEMLRGSALDAVRQWRYRPYMLNGEPTEVETSVTVNFSFGG